MPSFLPSALASGIFSGETTVKVPRPHKRLWRGLILLAIAALFVGTGIWAYNQYLSPSARAYATADTYMNALQKGDIDLAAYLTSGTPPPSALDSAAQAVKGGYDAAARTSGSNAYYLLYHLHGDNKYARAIVTKTASGYRVSSFLYSPSELSLVPDLTAPSVAVAQGPSGTGSAQTAGSDAGGSTGGGSPSTAAAPAPGGVAQGTVAQCLSQSDYSSVFVDAAPGDGTVWSAASPYSADVSFNPGASTYTDDIEIGDLLAEWEAFYQKFPSQNYTIGLQATATVDPALANSRLQRVQSTLTGSGIPASRMVPLTAKQVETTDTNPNADAAPTVTMLVIPGPGC